MGWKPGTVEATVDQRGLIDKVLGRYAGQFDLFRELLQNSDDANSSNAEIHFETSAYRDSREERQGALIDMESVSHWTLKNNGDKFDDSDWERLTTIALGNPDPRKIGAFGVGFYVVFSKTDSPFIHSGGKAMRFFWSGNQLSAECFAATDGPWTVFELPLREPASVPPLLELMRFLATSITFMVNLRVVQVSYNSHMIGRIKKSTSALQSIRVVPRLKEGFMTIRGIQQYSIEIHAETKAIVYTAIDTKDAPMTISLKSCEERTPQDCSQTYNSTADLMVFVADVNAAVPTVLLNKLDRSMKKHPPTDLQYSLIYDAAAKYEGLNEIFPHKDGSVFKGFLAGHDRQSLIFIGHATAQSTGIGGHMMSRFIPTVERELIDLSDDAASEWNRELLHVGGLLCRSIYEWELSDIQRSWSQDGSPTVASPREQLHERFLSILQFFTYQPSTPSEEVSDLLKASFCQGSPEPLRLLSSCGVHPSSGVKAYDQEFATFVKRIPMLSESVTVVGAHIISALPSQHRVLSLTRMEVFEYLREHSLTSEEMVSCLRWWAKLNDSDQASTSDAILLDSATLQRINGSKLQLSSVRYFIDSQGPWAHTKPDGPLPNTLIPHDISQNFTRSMLEKLGWEEFTIIPWLEYLLDPATASANPGHDLTKSRDWAEHVLDIIAGAWSSSSDKVHRDVKAMLQPKYCVPTTKSLSLPVSAYLPDANHHLSDNFDLPVVQFNKVPIDEKMKNFLSFIGVQTHAPLKLLLERQVDTGIWGIYEFIHHLIRMSPTVTAQYFLELKESAVFPSIEIEKSSSEHRYRADELYPPVEEFRKLGLRVINWNQPQLEWMDDSREAEFMYRLGLRRIPTLQTIIELCLSQGEVGETAFEYLCANLDLQYSDFSLNDFREQAFIPVEVEGEDKPSLRKPGEVFFNAEWKSLGFAVVPDRYRDIPLSRFGVQKDPPPSTLIGKLPPKKEIAVKWLEVLSKHISSFTQAELKELSVLEIVPTGPPGKQKLRPPKKCYLGRPPNYGFYSLIFAFVKFDPGVTHLLQTCGAKDAPTITDIVDALIADPKRFYALAGKDRFLTELRQLAHHNNRFSCDTMNELCCKPTLLGEKRERNDGQGQWTYKYELQKPEDIIIVDDDDDYQLFGDCIFVAPRDDELLQGFYESLGCERLSKLVHAERKREDLEEASDPENWTRIEVRELIQQRLPLFLQKCTHTKSNIDWLPDLNVRVWKTLAAPKILRLRKHQSITRQQDVWAIIEHGELGQVELWLSSSATRSMYELASCLCRLLFQTAKDKDIFFLESILSADPEILEARGFIAQPAAQQVDKRKIRHPAPEVIPINPSGGGGTMAGILRSFHAIGDTVSGVVREGVTMYYNSRNSTQTITRDEIRTMITAAVAASNAGNGKSPDGHSATTQFQSNYCEIERPGEDLEFRRQVAGIKVYVPQGGYRMDLVRHESLGRFIQIITPIAKVYGISNESLNIFCDNTPGRIAFNRHGRLYVNLLHFEKWHDQAVANGDRLQCQFSWYLTLAHEIAHNINRSHNTEHEFWFSEICEAFFVTFARKILPNGPPTL